MIGMIIKIYKQSQYEDLQILGIRRYRVNLYAFKLLEYEDTR